MAFLGAEPTRAENTDIGTIEIYEVPKGVSKRMKFGRSLWHLLLDFVTIGIWEVVATPGEILTNKEKTFVKVVYDQDMLVKNITVVR